jgi:DNA (cytosine-5)-methyltransferase 1
MVLLELFSGIGGFHVGLKNAGFVFDKVYYSEIDKHAIANYKYNFKESEYVGSVVDVSGTELRRKHPNAKFIITFGWPCQDNSIAGKRKGQVAGTRSFLLNEAVRLIREIQPYCFVAENVKGLYSVNDGKDFRDSLELLSYLDTDDFQYIVEHQLCNTSWVLPQNRERTYFVGYSAKRSWAGVFPITESDFGINERTTDTTVASITAGGHSGGHHSGMTLILRWQNKNAGAIESDFAPSLRSSGGTDIRKRPCVVAQRGRGEDNEQQLEPREDGLINTLTGVQKDNMIMVEHGTNGSLPLIDENNELHKRPRVMESCVKTEDEISPAITATNCSKNADNQPWIDMTVTNSVTPDAYLARGERNRDENGKAILTSMNKRRIRRLTEIECERLQGYVDGFTEFGDYDGVIKKIPKTPRYKLLGNAVTTNVVKLVGRRIKLKLF